MTTKRSGLPTFWATGIAKILSGVQPCQLQEWTKGHFNIEKRPRGDEGSLATWRANHSAQLSAAADRFRNDGWKVSVEQYFRVTGTTAILSGKVDLITQKAGERPVIRDVKSGRASDADPTQVLIYMTAIPLAWKSPDMTFAGEVIYEGSPAVSVLPGDAQALKPRLFALLKKLGSDEKPVAQPSLSACRFCELTDEDCPDRFREETAPVDLMTSEF